MRIGKISVAAAEKIITDFTGPSWKTARGNLPQIQKAALRCLNFPDLETAKKELAQRTVVLTLFSGAAERWINSLRAEEEQTGVLPFPPDRPRCLAPVYIFGRTRPIGQLALLATRDLGRHVLVVRKSDLPKINNQIVWPLQIPVDFVLEDLPRPLGHGHSAFLASDKIEDSDFVITNFGGDVNYYETIWNTLLVMAVLQKVLPEPQKPGVLLPAAVMEEPKYPIFLSPRGLAVGFGHPRNMEDLKYFASSNVPAPQTSNVGVRVYQVAKLLEALKFYRGMFNSEAGCYEIAGNRPGEFYLDNLDQYFADFLQARILAIADPREISPVKTIQDIPGFEEAVRFLYQGKMPV